MAERASEVTELKRNLAQALRDKEQLQQVKQHTVYIYLTGSSHYNTVTSYQVSALCEWAVTASSQYKQRRFW